MLRMAGILLSFVLSYAIIIEACDSKIDVDLCRQISNLQDTSQVKIQIILSSPPFNYPDKTRISLDSARNYSFMMIDSSQRNLKTLQPTIDSLYARYDLREVQKGDKRIVLPNIAYDYVMAVMATVATINQLTEERLIARLSRYYEPEPCAMTDGNELLLQNSTFPFDTVVNIKNSDRNRDSVNIYVSRYSKSIYFKRFPCPTMCPTTCYFDFTLPKIPKDSTSHLIQNAVSSQCKVDTSYHNKNIEYQVVIGGKILYMKVITINNDSMHLQFDITSSVLKLNNLAIRQGKSPQHQNGVINKGIKLNKCKLSYGRDIANCKSNTYFNLKGERLRNPGNFAKNNLIIYR